MTKPLKSYCQFIILILLLNSCNTYTTFYSTTFTSVPNNIRFSKIHRLDLSHQHLKSIPDISELKNLKTLHLSGNPDLDLVKEFAKVDFPKTIEVLVLDSLNLSTLPETIKQFSNLKQLSIAYNPLLDLNQTFDFIRELPLEFLNLKGNGIETLPDTIISLQSIKDLNLAHNALKGEKNYQLLGQLSNLYSLWLDHNDITFMPPTIGKLTQVRFLYIEHNKLSTLPNTMSKMKTWVIHAGYNNFMELPEVFTTMQSLFLVHINNNTIKRIPTSYESKKYSLAGLIMDNNPIDKKERIKAQKLFKDFFILSFEQN